MKTLKRFLACFTSLAMMTSIGFSEHTGTIFLIKPYAVSSIEHSVPSVEGGQVAIAIDQIELSPEQVKALDYKIPLFVKMTRNPGVNGIEFGIKADSELNMQMITDSKSAMNYINNPYDILNHTSNDAFLSLQMTVSSNAEKTMSWCTWSSATLYEDTGNVLLVVVTIPHDANGNLTGGNSRDGYQYYDVAYAETSAIASNLYGNNTELPVQYYNDSVEYSDGWIRIKTEEETTTVPDTTASAEETTTQITDTTPFSTETTTSLEAEKETTTVEENPLSSHTVPSVDGGEVAVSIDQIELTKKQVEDLNYQIPLFVKMDRNPGVTGMEFGIKTSGELDITSITDLNSAVNYINSPYDVIPNHTLNDAVHILHMTASFNTQGTLAWFTWSTNEVYTDTGSILLLVATIPHDAYGNLIGGSSRDGYQYYDIAYAETGALSSNLYGNNSKYPVLYYNDSVEYHDGWIRIKAEETTPAETTTTTTSTTPATTTTTTTSTTPATTTTATTTTTSATTTTTTTSTTTTTTTTATTSEIDSMPSSIFVTTAPIHSTTAVTSTSTTEMDSTTAVTTTSEKQVESMPSSIRVTTAPIISTTAVTSTSTTEMNSTTAVTTTQTETTTTETQPPLLLKETEVTMKTGQQYQIEANQENLTYSSSNPEIAVVSSNGIVTALKEGHAVISVINQNDDMVQINMTVVMEESTSYQMGDVNHDGGINAKDAAAVLVAAANIGSGHDSGFTKEESEAADVNADNTVNAKDAAEILVYAAVQGAGGTPSFSGENKAKQLPITAQISRKFKN